MTEFPEVAKQLIISKCIQKENILRAILLREKILNCSFEYDDVGHPLSVEQNSYKEVNIMDALFINGQDFYKIKKNIYLIFMAKYSLRPQRWFIFYWTEEDRIIIHGNRNSSNNETSSTSNSISKYDDETEDPDDSRFSTVLSILAELGDEIPRNYRIEVDDVDIKISDWLYQVHQKFKNNSLDPVSLTALRQLPGIKHLFQDVTMSMHDAKWWKMYNIVKLVDHAVKNREVLTIDGIDYHVGTWINHNIVDFNKKTIRADRLLALQQLNHNGSRFQTEMSMNDMKWWNMYNIVKG